MIVLYLTYLVRPMGLNLLSANGIADGVGGALSVESTSQTNPRHETKFKGKKGDREREIRSNETGKLVIAHRSVEFCEATPFDLVDEPKESLYGRETDRDLRSACRCVA